MNILIPAIAFAASSVSSPVFASITTCELLKSGGFSGSVSFDLEKVLLEVNRGNGPETLFGENSIYVIDAPAIAFSRADECKFSRKAITQGSVEETFSCGPDIKADFFLSFNVTTQSGVYRSVLNIPGQSPKSVALSFENCKPQ